MGLVYALWIVYQIEFLFCFLYSGLSRWVMGCLRMGGRWNKWSWLHDLCIELSLVAISSMGQWRTYAKTFTHQPDIYFQLCTPNVVIWLDKGASFAMITLGACVMLAWTGWRHSTCTVFAWCSLLSVAGIFYFSFDAVICTWLYLCLETLPAVETSFRSITRWSKCRLGSSHDMWTHTVGCNNRLRKEHV